MQKKLHQGVLSIIRYYEKIPRKQLPGYQINLGDSNKKQDQNHEDNAAYDRNGIDGAGKANSRLHLSGKGGNSCSNRAEHQKDQSFPYLKGKWQQEITNQCENHSKSKTHRKNSDNTADLRLVCSQFESDANHKHG